MNNLLTQRKSLEDQLALARAAGNTEQTDLLSNSIAEVNSQLVTAIENAKQMWLAVGGTEADAAIAKLQTAKIETQAYGQDTSNLYLQWDRVAGLFVGGLSNAFDQFSKTVAETGDVAQAAKDAFRQFASDFLRQIAQMIIQQMIFNMLQSAFGGTGFGNMIGLPIGTGHTGGLVGQSRVGSGNNTKRVSPLVFSGAQRYHSGGLVGFAPNEVPIIAEREEEILTRDDPRHILNGGGAGTEKSGDSGSMTLINTIDPVSFLEQALSQPKGGKVILNSIRANRTEVKSILR